MISKRRLGLAMAATLAALAFGPPPAFADTYPSRPIKYVVPFPPGGGVDTLARIVAEKLSARLGQQVIVDNRSGAGGLTGTRSGAKSPPDGYTLVAASFNYLTLPVLFPDLDFDIVKDLAPVILVAKFPCVLVVYPEVQAKTVKEMKALAGTPASLKFGSSSTGGGGHIAGELFNQMAGVKMVHVPYRGAAPMNVDLIAGRIDLAFAHITSILELIRGGRVRPLAITSDQRSPLLPDVPTMEQAGFPNFEAGELNGILVPAGTPPEIVARLNKEIVEILAMPDVKQKLEAQGAQIVASTPAEFATFIVTESARWGKVAKAAGIKSE